METAVKKVCIRQLPASMQQEDMVDLLQKESFSFSKDYEVIYFVKGNELSLQFSRIYLKVWNDDVLKRIIKVFDRKPLLNSSQILVVLSPYQMIADHTNGTKYNPIEIDPSYHAFLEREKAALENPDAEYETGEEIFKPIVLDNDDTLVDDNQFDFLNSIVVDFETTKKRKKKIRTREAERNDQFDIPLTIDEIERNLSNRIDMTDLDPKWDNYKLSLSKWSSFSISDKQSLTTYEALLNKYTREIRNMKGEMGLKMKSKSKVLADREFVMKYVEKEKEEKKEKEEVEKEEKKKISMNDWQRWTSVERLILFPEYKQIYLSLKQSGLYKTKGDIQKQANEVFIQQYVKVVKDEVVKGKVVKGKVVKDKVVKDEVVKDKVVKGKVVKGKVVKDEVVKGKVVKDEVVKNEVVKDEALELITWNKKNKKEKLKNHDFYGIYESHYTSLIPDLSINKGQMMTLAMKHANEEYIRRFILHNDNDNDKDKDNASSKQQNTHYDLTALTVLEQAKTTTIATKTNSPQLLKMPVIISSPPVHVVMSMSMDVPSHTPIPVVIEPVEVIKETKSMDKKPRVLVQPSKKGANSMRVASK